MRVTIGSNFIGINNLKPDSERIVLEPGAQKRFRGNCMFILNQGSFEMENALDDQPIEIKRNGHLCCVYVSITAGEKGCDLTLIRVPFEKRY